MFTIFSHLCEDCEFAKSQWWRFSTAFLISEKLVRSSLVV
jgi:hypothetical protein